MNRAVSVIIYLYLVQLFCAVLPMPFSFVTNDAIRHSLNPVESFLRISYNYYYNVTTVNQA